MGIGLILHSIARRSQEFEDQLQVLANELSRRQVETEMAQLKEMVGK